MFHILILRTTFSEREHQFEIRFSVMQTYENQRLEVDLCPQIVDQVGCIEIGMQRSGAFLGMVSMVQQTARNSSRLFRLREMVQRCP